MRYFARPAARAVPPLALAVLVAALLVPEGHASLGKRYAAEVRAEIAKGVPDTATFTEESIRNLPGPVQKHLRVCGYLGKPVMRNARLVWKEFNLKRSPKAGWMPMKAVQFNSVAPQPARLVYMKARWGGFLPFQGRDKFQDGRGNMLVETLSIFRLVNDESPEITQSEMVTVLAEALLVPSYALQPYITWETRDSLTVVGWLEYSGLKVSGVFHFNEAGEFIRFDTNDRWQSAGDSATIPWTATAEDYDWKKGVRVAGRYRAVWHQQDGDLEYFRGRLDRIDYNVKKP